MPGVGKTTLAVALCRAVDLDVAAAYSSRRTCCRRTSSASPCIEAQSGQFVYQPGRGDARQPASGRRNQPHLQQNAVRAAGGDGGAADHRGRAKPIRWKSPSSSSPRRTTSARRARSSSPTRRWIASWRACPSAIPITTRRWRCFGDRLSENPLDTVEQVLTREELLAMQADVRAVQTGDALLGLHHQADDGLPRAPE